MKKAVNISLFIIATILLHGCRTTDAVAQPATAVSFSVFYDELSPYGVWVQDPQYGYVWVPDVGTGFHPYYTNGYWVLTEYGNTWVSAYSWGWAPFHYGRWLYDPFYGWLWVPGYDWGPAWVYWRYGGGYYGWVPLAPGFVVTASFGVYSCPADWWIFVPHKYLYRKAFTHHVRDRRSNRLIINNTTVINNTYINRNRNTVYITGPSRDDYRQVSGRDVTVRTVSDLPQRAATYTRANDVRIYRPEIRKTDEAVAPAAPVKAKEPVRDPVPINTHGDRPAPFATELERTRPDRQPIQRTPQRTEPAQRIPQRTEPAQRIPQRTEPVQRPPQRTEPVQRTPQRAEPSRKEEPAQGTPQRR